MQTRIIMCDLLKILYFHLILYINHFGQQVAEGTRLAFLLVNIRPRTVTKSPMKRLQF